MPATEKNKIKNKTKKQKRVEKNIIRFGFDLVFVELRPILTMDFKFGLRF